MTSARLNDIASTAFYVDIYADMTDATIPVCQLPCRHRMPHHSRSPRLHHLFSCLCYPLSLSSDPQKSLFALSQTCCRRVCFTSRPVPHFHSPLGLSTVSVYTGYTGHRNTGRVPSRLALSRQLDGTGDGPVTPRIRPSSDGRMMGKRCCAGCIPTCPSLSHLPRLSTDSTLVTT